MNIILASNSPRRTQILTLAQIYHQVVPSACEETIAQNLEPYEVVESLSYQKAADVAKKYPNDIIIGADTIVVIDNQILGKPKNEQEAILMLEKLSAKTHHVITGITILSKNRCKTFHEITKVEIAQLSKQDITTYLKEENVYDKAGSYGIQGIFCKYITKIEGDYYNVMGLPIAKVYKELKEFNNEI
ncbi:MAG: Maf family protein [Christensenellales bacterium]